MAYITLAPTVPSNSALNQAYTGISTAATGIKDTYLLGAFHSTVSMSAVATSASSTDLEMCCCPVDVILAGGGIWVPVVGMTAIAATAKLVSFVGVLSAIRVNVKTLLAGSLSLSIKTSNQY